MYVNKYTTTTNNNSAKRRKKYKHKEKCHRNKYRTQNKLTKCMKKCINKSLVTTEKEKKHKSIEKSMK